MRSGGNQTDMTHHINTGESWKEHRKIRRDRRKERIQSDLENFGRDILNSEEMRAAFQQTHHTRSTVGEHTRRVAEKSLAICYALDRLHIRTDISMVVKSSLCHDLGILGRDEKYESEKECSMRHPTDSVKVAENLVSNLSEKTKDIIIRHMWPKGQSKAPNSLEGIIVSIADKIAAVEDFFRGSKVKRIGINESFYNIIKREGDGKWKMKKR